MDVTTATVLGRHHPAATLNSKIAAAAKGHGGLVLVCGEAGIGKTTLVGAAAELARRRGALVLSGWCSEADGTPGYWPWVQVLRSLRRSVDTDEWASIERATGHNVTVLLGEQVSTATTEPFALYDAVTSALVQASERRPIMVVLDDLHWADPASLRLLQFAMHQSWLQSLLLVGTFRDVEVETVRHPLRSLMASLTAKATTIALDGLERDEVGELIARTAGREPDGELIDSVYHRTGGNPFFVEQTTRLWCSIGSVSLVPPQVSDAIRARLDLLAPPVAQILSVAAVLGRHFRRHLLAATAEVPAAEVNRLLEQATMARLIVMQPAGRFAFTHDLVRESLYEALPESRRCQYHAAAVAALESTDADGPPVAGELARHASLAGPSLDSERAVRLLLTAARDAAARLATEEAVGHYRRALQRIGDEEPRRRALIELDLAQELQPLGERDAAWQLFERVSDTARALDDAELLARAALVMHGIGPQDSERRQLSLALLREAHRRLDDDDGGQGSSVMPADHLARDLTVWVAAHARRDADDEALAFSLWARHDAILGLGSAAERAALIDELMAVARRREDHALEQFAATQRWVAALEQGDPAYLEHYEAFLAMAARRSMDRFTYASYIDRSIVSAHTGHFDAAERLLEEGLRPDRAAEHLEFAYVGDHVLWSLRLLQGRFEALEDLHHRLATTEHPYPRLLQAITAAERGDISAALAYVAELHASEEQMPRAVEPLRLRLLALTAAASRRADLCAQVREGLTPFSGQWLVSLYGCDVSGPVDLWLGMVDAAQDQWESAERRLTAAFQSADRLRARPWSVLARAALVDVLRARHQQDAAAALAHQVRNDATALGMPHIVGRFADPAPAAADQTPEFRRTGTLWRLAFAGRTVQVPDAKGLRDLHYLLSHPGTDVPAVHLLRPEGGALVVAARSSGGDAVLDETAKQQYRSRLEQLEAQIDQALSGRNDQHAQRLDAERQALIEQLASAAGLGGRSRRLGDESERARKAVTARIHDTLRRLDTRHPALATHLRAAVSTGATCRYLPDGDVPWRL